jgi:hypothetical protein
VWVMADRANPVVVAMAQWCCAGNGRAQRRQGQDGHKEGFHCDLQNG